MPRGVRTWSRASQRAFSSIHPVVEDSSVTHEMIRHDETAGGCVSPSVRVFRESYMCTFGTLRFLVSGQTEIHLEGTRERELSAAPAHMSFAAAGRDTCHLREANIGT